MGLEGAEGNDEEASGSSCFSVLADVNEIARWHLNALQKDRSLLLQLLQGLSFACIPRSGLMLSLAVGVMRGSVPFQTRRLFARMLLP